MTRYLKIALSLLSLTSAPAEAADASDAYAEQSACPALGVNKYGDPVIRPIFMTEENPACKLLPNFTVVKNKTKEFIVPEFSGITKLKVLETDSSTGDFIVDAIKVAGEAIPVSGIAPYSTVYVNLTYTSVLVSGRGYAGQATGSYSWFEGVLFHVFSPKVPGAGYVAALQTTICTDTHYTTASPMNMREGNYPVITFDYAVSCVALDQK